MDAVGCFSASEQLFQPNSSMEAQGWLIEAVENRPEKGQKSL
jgi:hypothetical protein